MGTGSGTGRMPLLAAAALAGTADRAAPAGMPLLARAAAAQPTAAGEGAAARGVNAAGRAHVAESAAEPRAAQARARLDRGGRQRQSGGREHPAADQDRGSAHGFTFASAIGLASLAGLKAKVPAGKLGLTFQVSSAE